MKNSHKFYDMTREEKMTDWYRKINLAWKAGKNDWFINHNPINIGWHWDILGEYPLDLSYTMFIACLQNMCDDQQKAKWLPLALSARITGAYAQTELGHGSDVSGLETTATFDQDKDEFVIHTPNIRATKWWPGDISHHATHCVVFAKMVIDGSAFGVLPFIVQLRDPQTFDVCRGIRMGDMGPKLGYNGKNNGWV